MIKCKGSRIVICAKSASHLAACIDFKAAVDEISPLSGVSDVYSGQCAVYE